MSPALNLLRVPHGHPEVCAGWLEASKRTGMLDLLPVLSQNKLSPSPNKLRRAWIQEKIISRHRQSSRPAPVPSPSKGYKAEAPRPHAPRNGLTARQSPWAANSLHMCLHTICK